MIANKWIQAVLGGCFLLAGTQVMAVQNLDAHGQTKVNNAMAKKWATSTGGANPAQQNTVVNVGSKRGGGCNLNVGAVDPNTPKGQRPKDIVVTTKEVINVCK